MLLLSNFEKTSWESPEFARCAVTAAEQYQVTLPPSSDPAVWLRFPSLPLSFIPPIFPSRLFLWVF